LINWSDSMKMHGVTIRSTAKVGLKMEFNKNGSWFKKLTQTTYQVDCQQKMFP